MRIDFSKLNTVMLNQIFENFVRNFANKKHNKKDFYKYLKTSFKDNPSYFTLYLDYLIKNELHHNKKITNTRRENNR